MGEVKVHDARGLTGCWGWEEGMHGLVFVTWEKYLAERFGTSLLDDYRKAIGEGIGATPLASRVYSDEQLLAGVAAASRLTRVAADALLHEYGRYFILNGLTSRLCAYLLNEVHGGRDLLLMMRSAHEQMNHAEESVMSPVFEYQAMPSDPFGLYLIYDSPRQLCSLLLGAIEGAAVRYGERAQVREQTCMKHGAPTCTFAIRFLRPSGPSRAASMPTTSAAEYAPSVSQPAPWQQERWEAQRLLADAVYAVLPDADGISLDEVQGRLRMHVAEVGAATRPFLVLEALNHLSHAGWAASSANQPGDTLGSRRYWRVPRAGS